MWRLAGTRLSVNHGGIISHVCSAGESAAAAFRDLKKLSRVFKDQLAYPLIAAAREGTVTHRPTRQLLCCPCWLQVLFSLLFPAMALPVAFGLAALPPELLLRVLRLLDARAVVRLSSVCRHFNVATADSSLWRHLYRRDFTGEWSGCYNSLFLKGSLWWTVNICVVHQIQVPADPETRTGKRWELQPAQIQHIMISIITVNQQFMVTSFHCLN